MKAENCSWFNLVEPVDELTLEWYATIDTTTELSPFHPIPHTPADRSTATLQPCRLC